MRYTLLIKKQAKKALQSLARTDRNRIAEKITLLGVYSGSIRTPIPALVEH